MKILNPASGGISFFYTFHNFTGSIIGFINTKATNQYAYSIYIRLKKSVHKQKSPQTKALLFLA